MEAVLPALPPASAPQPERQNRASAHAASAVRAKAKKPLNALAPPARTPVRVAVREKDGLFAAALFWEVEPLFALIAVFMNVNRILV